MKDTRHTIAYINNKDNATQLELQADKAVFLKKCAEQQIVQSQTVTRTEQKLIQYQTKLVIAQSQMHMRFFKDGQLRQIQNTVKKPFQKNKGPICG